MEAVVFLALNIVDLALSSADDTRDGIVFDSREPYFGTLRLSGQVNDPTPWWATKTSGLHWTRRTTSVAMALEY